MSIRGMLSWPWAALAGCAGLQQAPSPGAVDDTGPPEWLGAGRDAAVFPVYVDGDGDGFGAGPPHDNRLCAGRAWCDLVPEGFSRSDADCDDADPRVHPLASVLRSAEPGVDGVDEDCDGLVDEGYAFALEDRDLDGYPRPGAPVLLTRFAAEAPGRLIVGADFDPEGGVWDCDDTRASIHPGAVELPLSGLDEDCDGLELCLVDADGDQLGDDAAGFVETPDWSCRSPGLAGEPGDCDDADPKIYLLAAEDDTNGVDDDCDGRVDEYDCSGRLQLSLVGAPSGYGEVYVRVFDAHRAVMPFSFRGPDGALVSTTVGHWGSGGPGRPGTHAHIGALQPDGAVHVVLTQRFSRFEVRVAGWTGAASTQAGRWLDVTTLGASFDVLTGAPYPPSSIGVLWCADAFVRVDCARVGDAAHCTPTVVGER